MAALPVSDINVVPEGMISRTIPASKYAVFTSKGPLANLSKTYNYIYGTWLPQSGCKLSQSSDFEFYDERFDPNNDEKSEVDIYIPIQS
jgi:AraC family transcriptional regulator